MLNLNFNENGLFAGSLLLRRDSLLKHIKEKPSVVSISSIFAKDRQEVEAFIQDVYEQSYRAHIKVHYPVLMSIRDERGRILSAAGFRLAKKNSLFLEQYLSAPIEHVLNTTRDKIVEVGNLASIGNGGSLYLFTSLTAYLSNKGLDHIVVTSTQSLERRFKQMGLNPKRYAKADLNKLIRNDEDWGSYYHTEPKVLSGSTQESYRKLQEKLGADYSLHRQRLFPRLHYKDEFDVA